MQHDLLSVQSAVERQSLHGEEPHQLACILEIGHDDGAHENPARWESGLRSIVSILLGNRSRFEIVDVVGLVRGLRRVLEAARGVVYKNGPIDDPLVVRLLNEVDAYDCSLRRIQGSPSWSTHVLGTAGRCVCGNPEAGWLEDPSAGRIPFCAFHEKDARAVASGMGATLYTKEPL